MSELDETDSTRQDFEEGAFSAGAAAGDAPSGYAAATNLSGSDDKRLQFILRTLAGPINAQAAFICLHASDGRLEIASTFRAHDSARMPVMAGFSRQLHDHLLAYMPEAEGQHLLLTTPDGFHALVYPFIILAEMPGAVVLISDHPLDEASSASEDSEALVDMARAMIENRHLTERLIATEAITTIARAIAQDPAPQHIVEILGTYLFDEHIASCVLGVFGPRSPDDPGAPFDFLEIQGVWLRDGGDHIDPQMRVDLTRYPELIELLAEQNTFTLTDLNRLAAQLDEETMAFFRQVGAQSVTVIQLTANTYPLGILSITTDRPHEFSSHELRTYQIVAEYLAVTVAARSLRQQREFVQQGQAALLEAVSDGVMMVLPDERSTLVTANEQFLTMFRLDANLMHNRLSLWDVLGMMHIPGEVRRELYAIWQQIDPLDLEIFEGEFSMTGPLGAQVDIQWYTAPVFQTGIVSGRIYTFFDCTAERMGERLRTELLARLSHELRTPLTAIQGFAEFILSMPTSEVPDSVRDYTIIIRKSAIHLSSLFNHIIEITRANSGGIKLYLSEARLQDVIIEAAARLELEHKRRSQRVILDLNDDMPTLEMDVDRIMQVVTNLLMNAIKYSPPGTTICVSTCPALDLAELPASAPRDTVTPCILVSIIDEGQGIAQEDVENIFLPFYRTRAARAALVEGTGLGLSIARAVIHLHSGKVWAQGATRRHPGGRFYFTIPVVSA